MNHTYFAALKNEELERLALLVEEAAEVQQIAMKVIRHGYYSHNPFDKNKTTNKELLEMELGHLQFAVQLMKHHSDISEHEIEASALKKMGSVKKYLHHTKLTRD